MTAMTPLEQALAAWIHAHTSKLDEVERNQILYDDAAALAEWGVFSNRNIAQITGLDEYKVVPEITHKSDKTGGRLAPASLPLLLDARMEYVTTGRVQTPLIEAIWSLGTSFGVIAKLIECPKSTVYSWRER